MNHSISADIHQWIHLVLTCVVLIFSLVDFFRYQSITYPLLSKNFGLLCAVFFLLITPTLNVLFNHFHLLSLVQMTGVGFFNLTTGSFLFVAGYVWVRRCPWRDENRRHDLQWKKILRAGPDGVSVEYDPRAVLLGILLGVALAFLSIVYMKVMNRFVPEYLSRINSNMPKKNLAAYIYLALNAVFWEELFYRWYLFHGLQYLFRHFRAGRIIAIILTSAAFAAGHYGYADPVWIKEAQTFVISAVLCGFFPQIGLEGCIIAHLTINMIGLLSLF